MSKLPKIIKLEQRGCKGIINKTDQLLSQGLSYRKIAKELMRIYLVPISYQSIKRYKDYKEQLVKDSKTNKPSYDIYICIRPIKKHSLM